MNFYSKYILALIIVVFIITSCRQATKLGENEKSVIIKEVQQTLDNYYEDIRKSGMTAEFKYLDHSAEFFWVPPGYKSSISYDSVATILNQNASRYKSIVNVFDTLRIIPLSRELATYTGRLKSTMIDTSGKVLAHLFIETGILIKRSEGWKLLNGQTSVVRQ